MADINSRATVTLTVNGKQAQQMLNDLRQKADKLQTSIDKATKAGNTKKYQQLRKELGNVNKQMDLIQKATESTDRVMRRLDTASPKELNKTLSQLKRELNNMERGTKAWDKQTAAIRRVKAEIDKVNAAQRESLTTGQKLNNIFNDWGGSILAAAAAIGTFVMAGRKAVSDFAELDQEIANVMKFTSMSREDVVKLNEEMKKMDSRTDLLTLNRYAEDAGKLGMKTIEDIMGYVRGADKINVALSDIGDGATLMLSKLSSIFGLKDEYGTEDSLVRIGSTITELSQNCTASSAYLANFARRMGGVGKAANMTLPQLIGIGAVLDANGQAAEMSATAVSKLIMDAYKESDKFAKALQLDSAEFNKLMSTDANAGFIRIIERFKEIGNLDALAPVFKDMGENGARASQVMSTLSNNLDMLKWEQGEAQKAFDKGTKATEMYNIQNSTIQANMEKARKRIYNLRVELGEKLMPVMVNITRTTTLTMKTLNVLVDFIIKYHGQLLSLTTAIVAYYVATNIATIKTKAFSAAQLLAKVATSAWTAATFLAKSAVALFAGNITTARRAFILFSAAIKANPIGLIAAAITGVVTGLAVWISKTKELTSLQKANKDITDSTNKTYAEQKSKLDVLISTAENENASLAERNKAILQINKIIPNYNASLDATTGKYTANKKALDEYLNSLKEEIKLKAMRGKLEELYKKKTELEIEVSQKEKHTRNIQIGNTFTSPSAFTPVNPWIDIKAKGEFEVSSLKRQIKETEVAISSLKKYIFKKAPKNVILPSTLLEEQSENTFNGNDSDLPGGSAGASISTSGKDSWLSKRKELFEREQLILKISYEKGQLDYSEYTRNLSLLTSAYYKDVTESVKVGESEKLKLQEELLEYNFTRMQNLSSEQYDNMFAAIRQRYIDGEISYEEYNERINLLTLQQLQDQVRLFKQGSPEYVNALKSYQEKVISEHQRKQKEEQDREKEHNDKLKKIKDEYFGQSASENKANYDSSIIALDEVYNQELAKCGDNADEKLRIDEAYQKARLALALKYNQDIDEQGKNLMQTFASDVKEFLDSDGGKAIMSSFDTLVSGLSNIFSGLTSIIDSETEIQMSRIDKKYEKELSSAEGNSYKVKQIELQKEKEQASIQNKANKRKFKMQIIQAVAQTAQGAINAYSSAAAIPLIGYIIAPIAASMAIAAGMLQVAAIKKQQQASEAQGYKRGGYTGKGNTDDVAGVVHANEWVASEKLVKNPVSRAMIERLDYAQRTNRIGDLGGAQYLVSGDSEQVSSALHANTVMLAAYADALMKLNKRLDEPFVTVNTVTGTHGIKQAQDDYEKLIKNKSPK